MLEVSNLNEEALLSARELEERVAMGNKAAEKEKAERLKKLRKPHAIVSSKTKRSVEGLKQLAVKGNKGAQTEIQRRLEKVKAPTLSERAERGDEEAREKVKARADARLQLELSQKRKEAEARVLAVVREDIVKTPTTKGKKKYNENVISRDLYKAAKASSEPSKETTEVLAEIRRMNVPDEIELADEDLMEMEERPSSSKLITSEHTKAVSGEIKQRPEKIAAIKNEGAAEPGLSAVEIDRQYVKESQVEEAQAAYVRAYREYDPKFTQNKTDDLLAVTRPPFFAFGAKAEELKNLYNDLNLARKSAASESDEERIRKNLPVAPDKPSRRTAPLSAEKRAALDESWYEPEEKKEIRFEPVATSDYLRAQPESKPAVKMPIHERVASAKNILEDTGEMLRERGGGIHRRVKEIEAFFSKKYGLKQGDARKFLLGAEIKGLFKGGQKRMQEEYKGYSKNELYQKFLKENPGR